MTRRTTKADLGLLVAPLLCFGFAWLLSQLEFMQRFEWRSLDWRTQVRAQWGQPAPDDRLLVLGIGEHTTLNIEPWPFGRAYHGQLQYLARHDPPRVWAWDIIFADRRRRDGTAVDAAGDLTFSVATEALAELDVPVVFAAVASELDQAEALASPGLTAPIPHVVGDISQLEGDISATLPFPDLRAHGYFGFADAPRGAGGIVRHMPLLVRIGEAVYPSLALQTVMQYWRVPADEVRVVLGESIRLGREAEGREIPIDAAGRLLVNYRYEKVEPGETTGRDFPVVEYFNQLIALDQYYEQGATDARPPVPMRDRIVMVGEFSTDTGATPFADQSPLVLLQANVLNSILTGDFVRRVPAAWIWWGALLMGYAGIGLMRRRSVWWLSLFTLLTAGGFAASAFALWRAQSVWVPLVGPLVGFGLLQFGFFVYRVWVEQAAKQQIRSMFGSYLSPVVINQMVASGEQPVLGGSAVELTAYFSDIQSFSAFSEVLEPPRLVSLLNEYLTACTDIIQEQGGTLDKYIGDAVVAMFGAPVPLPDHAYRACLTSLLVQRKQAELRAAWQAQGETWPPLVHRMRTRIGLNTGRCMVGNMGSRTRFDYTMMGDNVNLAARMESGAKFWGVYNMVTEETRRACEAHAEGRIVFRALGRIRVKGRQAPVAVHEVMGLQEDHDAEGEGLRAAFEQALHWFYAGDLEAAAQGFRICVPRERLQPERDEGILTNPSLTYLKVVEELQRRPLPADWDGVYEMLSK
ncbi:CHASE2 domain-containing protein [Actomonas aquatica]|uniref:Adenylate/guanylate cyclase domain-containing protein n=1 Tax=Actomonas aquatica TaxID=2866162 RepID=A0ABZ1C898_9BACT|nr:adenylate/guanylate cyclase domain-containing protein [Opitutus sp. WL0086]WRQ87691.1 adenylate/guanylate cyclase domain-containing protein [Opitutus sp. WL0086]